MSTQGEFLVARCRGCNKGYKVGHDKAGRRFKCKSCGGVVAVPAAAEDDWGAGGDDEWGAADWSGGAQQQNAGYGAPARRSTPRQRAVQKKSAGPLILWISLSVVVVAGISVGLYFLLRDDGSKKENNNQNVADNGGGGKHDGGAVPPGPNPFPNPGGNDPGINLGNNGGNAGNNGGNSGNANVPGRLETAFVPNDAIAAIRVDAASLLTLLGPAANGLLPPQMPIKLTDFSSAVAYLAPPTDLVPRLQQTQNPEALSAQIGSESAGFVVHFKKDINFQQLMQGMARAGRVATYRGKSYVTMPGQQPGAPEMGFYFPNPRAAVVATRYRIRKTIDGTSGNPAPLIALMQNTEAKTDVVVVATLRGRDDVKKLANLAAAGAPPAKAEIAKYVKAAADIQTIRLFFDVTDDSNKLMLDLSADFSSSESAGTLYQGLLGVKQLAETTLGVLALQAGNDPQAKADINALTEVVKSARTRRRNSLIRVFVSKPQGLETSLIRLIQQGMQSGPNEPNPPVGPGPAPRPNLPDTKPPASTLPVPPPPPPGG